MMLLRALVIWLMLAMPMGAQTPVPQSIADTLELMRGAYQADPRVSNVIVNFDQKYLSFQVDGSDTQISFPDNLHILLTQAQTDAERTEILNRMAQSAIQSIVALTLDVPFDVANVIPIVRNATYGIDVLLVDGHDTNIQEMTPLISFPFVGDMRIFLVEDAPKVVKFLTKADLQTTELGVDALLLEAVMNARSGLEDVKIENQGGLSFLIFDGNYETSFLTTPSLWNDLDTQIGTIVAVVAARDLVLFVDGDDATALADLREVIKPEISQFSYPISTTLITWKDGRWSLYD